MLYSGGVYILYMLEISFHGYDFPSCSLPGRCHNYNVKHLDILFTHLCVVIRQISWHNSWQQVVKCRFFSLSFQSLEHKWKYGVRLMGIGVQPSYDIIKGAPFPSDIFYFVCEAHRIAMRTIKMGHIVLKTTTTISHLHADDRYAKLDWDGRRNCKPTKVTKCRSKTNLLLF